MGFEGFCCCFVHVFIVGITVRFTLKIIFAAAEIMKGQQFIADILHIFGCSIHKVSDGLNVFYGIVEARNDWGADQEGFSREVRTQLGEIV